MKAMIWLLLAAHLCLPLAASGVDTEALTDLPQLELIPDIHPEQVDLGQGLQGLYSSGLTILRSQLGGVLELGLRMLSICMLLSLLTAFAKSGGLALPERAADMAGVCAITLLALQQGGGVLQECIQAVGDLVQYGNILFPVYAGAVAVAGHPVSAAAQAGATMLFAGLVMRFASGMFLPAAQGYILLNAAGLLAENGLLSRAAGMLRACALCLLRILLLAFTGYLALSGIISSGADATAVKAARFALTSTVPVVGIMIADASDALLSGAAVLKNSIGLFGCFAACAICLAPFVRCFLHFSLFRILAALAEPFSGSRCGAMLRTVSDAFGLSLGLLGACCALQFLSFVVSTVVMA